MEQGDILVIEGREEKSRPERVLGMLVGIWVGDAPRKETRRGSHCFCMLWVSRQRRQEYITGKLSSGTGSFQDVGE
jgi:hypothetical protein